MTRLQTLGWGWYSGAESAEGSSGGGVGPSTTVGRSPQIRSFYLSGAGNYQVFTFDGASLNTNQYHRIWINIHTMPSADALILILQNQSAGPNVRLWLQAATQKLFMEMIGPGSSGTLSAALSVDVWYCLRFRVKTGSGTGDDELQWWLDGTEIENLTGLTGTNATSPQNQIQLMAQTAQWNAADFAVNDSNGTFENGLPRMDTYVGLLVPTSDNQVGSWVGGGGGTSNLFEALNNKQPVGVSASQTNATQIESTDSSGDNSTDEYRANLEAPTDIGANAGDTLVLIQPIVNHGEESATGTKTGSFGMQANPAEGSYGGTINPFGPSAGGALANYPDQTWRWSWGAALDISAQSPTAVPVIGLRKTDTGTRVASVDALGAYIEWVPILIPDAPIMSSATPGNQTVDLAWTTPADHGSSITNYEVWRSTSTNTEAWVADVGVVNAWQDTGRSNGTQYFYKVLATNIHGSGALSNELSATPVHYGVDVFLVGSPL